MAPEESTVRLYHRLEDVLGRETATALADHLEALATKRDIADLREATKQDIADLRAEMRETFVTKVESAEFKSEVAAGFAEVKVAMANLESKLHRDMKNMALVLVGTNVALVATGMAAVRFV